MEEKLDIVNGTLGAKVLGDWLKNLGWSETVIEWAVRSAVFLVLILLAFVAHFVARAVLLRILPILARRSPFTWDDIMIKAGVFQFLPHLVPALVLYGFTPLLFEGYESVGALTQRLALIYMLSIGLFTVFALSDALITIFGNMQALRRLPLRSFAQVVKIITFFLAFIMTLSILVGKSPLILVGGLGAMAAILMLVFKDPILGFVAGIQLSANNMLQVGDWIEMPKYGADGDVIDIALTTIKVQNWDKTITTIPAYALISDAFINWRGMSESGGRRIKRSIFIDMTSIRFCTPEMLAGFRRFRLLRGYLEKKEAELAEFNCKLGEDDADCNGRRLTNIGTFRAYVAAYLRQHPKISQDMTFLVRHLQPTDKGLPIEIYVFSNDQVWANYEGIQADIFDHILAVLPHFGLRIFQVPTGADLQSIGGVTDSHEKPKAMDSSAAAIAAISPAPSRRAIAGAASSAGE